MPLPRPVLLALAGKRTPPDRPRSGHGKSSSAVAVPELQSHFEEGADLVLRPRGGDARLMRQLEV